MSDEELLEFRLGTISTVFYGSFVGGAVSWALSLPKLFPVSIKDINNRGTFGTSILTVSLLIAIGGFMGATGIIEDGFGGVEAIGYVIFFVLLAIGILIITFIDPDGRLWYPLKMRYFFPDENHKLSVFYAAFIVIISVPQAIYDFFPEEPWWPGLTTIGIQLVIYVILGWIYAVTGMDSDRFSVPDRSNVDPIRFVIITGSIHLIQVFALLLAKETQPGDRVVFQVVNAGLSAFWIIVVTIYWLAWGSRFELIRASQSRYIKVRQ